MGAASGSIFISETPTQDEQNSENVGSNLDSSLQLLDIEFEDPHSNWVNLGCFNHSSGPKTYRANFDLVEIVVFDSVVSSENATQIKDYLNAKHSIY